MTATEIPKDPADRHDTPSAPGAYRAAGEGMLAGPRGRVRLGTLNNLRWLGVAGQSAAVFVVHFGLGFPLPLIACTIAILMGAALNIVLSVMWPAQRRLTGREATLLLIYDIVQLAALLYLTGGIANPFALMFIAPVVISATILDLGNTLLLGGVSFAVISALAVFHRPLPWTEGDAPALPPLYLGGIWISLVLGVGFTAIYAWRIASEAARLSAAFSAAQFALAREHRLAALGALSAAAAHELGTPLGTIALVSRELERELPADFEHANDIRLLRSEADRCRAILARLGRPEEAVLGTAERMPLGALLDHVASPHRGLDIAIAIETQAGPAPKIWVLPEILHGLGNVIENAADFARARVAVRAFWNDRVLGVEIADDGPGFAPGIIERIGDPYVTSRPGRDALAETERGPREPYAGQEGMGLGFFIARTLIEQTGGALEAVNRPDGGAAVTAIWPRGAIDGAQPPSQAF